MSATALADDVQRLLREEISSLEQLEVLLLLRREEPREFDAQQMNDALRSSETSAALRLADLSKRQLIVSRQDGSRVLYRYQPHSSELRATLDRMAEAYSTHRYTVITLIFSKPMDDLTLFAKAFRFKKDDSDG